MTNRLAARRSQRSKVVDYGSDQRAGSYARRTARERHRRFVRTNWRWLTGPNLFGIAIFLPGALLLPDAAGAFFLGVGVTLILCLTAGAVVLLSGTAGVLMGEVAEQWTAQELRKLQLHQWHLANHVFLRGTGDIDHVLIGPGGVVVVETKWSGDPWFKGAYNRNRLDTAARTVTQSARDLHAHLGKPSIPVVPVVVLWGSGLGELPESEQVQKMGHATVVTAAGMDAWLRTVQQGQVPPSDVERHWSALVSHIERRESAMPEAPIPSSVSEIAQRASLALGGFVLGLFFGAFLWQPIQHLPGWIAALGCGAAIGAVARRAQSLRLPATAFILGVALWLVLLVPLLAYAYLQ